MGSHSVTCDPAEVTFQPLPQPVCDSKVPFSVALKPKSIKLAGWELVRNSFEAKFRYAI